MKILVADDDPIIRKLLFEVLTHDGHQVIVRENGFEALKEAQKQPFDLVFLDVHMPIMNGLETLISIRNQFPGMAVAMMDSYPDQLVRQAQREGALTCIHKPFDLKEIREVVEEVRNLALKDSS
ncbi:MAG: response regulator [candidate division Zixibacteria bacterium]|nr:response regulator [candidate division Zixibacteria bacterium]